MPTKPIVNTFLVVLLGCVLIDAVPTVSRGHKKLKQTIDPVLDVTGLWQESWRLFAPKVAKQNVRLSARIRYRDGLMTTWASPDWTQMTALERFLDFREMEYVDSIRLNSNKGAWPSLADYLARTLRHPTDPSVDVVEVVLTRHWETVPPPPGVRRKKRKRDKGNYDFYRETYQ